MPKPRPKLCVDCEKERERRGDPPPKYPRQALHPGPRCATHHRQKKRADKARVHERRVQKTYGLQPGQYWELYKFQGGKCAICRRATGATRALSVDHDHKTGLVRGEICRLCNDMLGHGRDDPAFFVRAAQYLNNPPAKQLGIVAIHQENREEG